MQMLLHDDPRNAARERAGQLPVTAIWIADAGVLTAARYDATTQWFAPPGRAGDVARGLAANGPDGVAPSPAGLAHLATTTDAVVIFADLHTPAALDAAMTAWLMPALTALDGGMLDALTVVATDGRGAFVWMPRAMSWWTRWRPWSRPTAFVPPAAPDLS
jgi:hypothetical protein